MSTWQLVLTLSVLAVVMGMSVMALFYLTGGAPADEARPADTRVRPAEQPAGLPEIAATPAGDGLRQRQAGS